MSADSERKQDDYQFYKTHGICVRCHEEPAEDGSTMCLGCKMDHRQKSKERYDLQKAAGTLPDRTQERAERAAKRKESGICISCGSRPARPGKSCCWRCLEKARQRSAERRTENGCSCRSLMGKDGTCYFCGEPAVQGRKTCPRCYERCKAQMLYARSKREGRNYFEQRVKAKQEGPNGQT